MKLLLFFLEPVCKKRLTPTLAYSVLEARSGDQAIDNSGGVVYTDDTLRMR